MTTTFTVTEIALNKLDTAAANVRCTGRGNGIEELAASIAAHGLLQSLVVARASVVLRGLIERGLLEVAAAEAGPCCLFTPTGLDGLRAYFSRQPVDFRVLFPRLHHELGLDDLLRRGERRD